MERYMENKSLNYTLQTIRINNNKKEVGGRYDEIRELAEEKVTDLEEEHRLI